jgi:hypothetical protein
MFHFNSNSDRNGLATDSLHKVRPLLEILKRSIGHYASFGSELSFDEATMACFSRNARGLISFNPKKPTGKFHFKVYMLCCAITNLVYKIHIHTKDGCDNDADPVEEDVMVNRTDKLMLDMWKIVRGTGATINMNNYYMSPMCAVNLWKKQIFAAVQFVVIESFFQRVSSLHLRKLENWKEERPELQSTNLTN